MDGGLTDREIAALLWLAAAAFVLLRPRARRMSLNIARGLLGAIRPFWLLIGGFVVFYGFVVVIAANLGLWNVGLAKETVAWLALPGMKLLFSFTKTYEEPGYLRRQVIGVVGLTAIVEGYVALGSFPLPVELVLLPMVVLLGLFSALGAIRPEFHGFKVWSDRLIAVAGLVVLAQVTAFLVTSRDTIDWWQVGLLFLLPVWSTAAALMFVVTFGLYANYQPKLDEINRRLPDQRQARWRAKAALVCSFHVRNRELGRFSSFDARRLAQTTSFREARAMIRETRAAVREQERKKQEAADRLIRYAGVKGTDEHGQQLDQREFAETKRALDDLATYQGAHYRSWHRYDIDILERVGRLLTRKLPRDAVFEVRVRKDGKTWMGWRRTVTGWCLGVGAVGSPTETWVYDGQEPPQSFPPRSGEGRDGWRRGPFAWDEEDEAA